MKDVPESSKASETGAKMNFVEYPVAPTQPMLTDRSSRSRRPPTTTNNSKLPNSLQSSPDRDDIICFAQMQTSPKENQANGKGLTIDSSYVAGAPVPLPMQSHKSGRSQP